MGKDLIISANRHETKVAIMEDEQLVEIFYQRANEYSLVGSIHKGRVTRVLPGMQSAFVDIGLDRDAFLYVSDFFEDSEEYEQLPGDDVKPSPQSLRAAAPAADEGETEERERPRRGRRSRRRRSKGRGFPESKYAAADEEATDEESPKLAEERREPRESREGRDPRERREGRDSRERREGRESRETRETREPRPSRGRREAPEPEEDSEPGEFMLLPGESLAKYSRSAEPAEAVTDEEEADAAVAEEPEAADPAAPDTAAEEADSSDDKRQEEAAAELKHESSAPDQPAGEEKDSEKEVEQDRADEGDDSERPESAKAPEEIAVSAVDSESEKTEGESESEGASSEEQPEEGRPEKQEASSGTADTEEETETEGEEAASPKPSRSSRGRRGGRRGRGGRKTENEDDDIKAMILGQLDDSLKAELAAEAEKENAEEAGKGRASSQTKEEAAEAVSEEKAGDDEADDAPTEGSAAVRDPEHRYPQRVSRRGRRRGRGGRNDSRQSSDAKDAESRDEETADAAVPRPAKDDSDTSDGGSDRKTPETRGKGDKGPLPLISDLLKEGQEVLVQIAKEPMGQKGARITSHIALPGRYVVYMPTLDHLGVSRKIGSDKERQRLRRCLQSNRDGIPGGFIMRTAGEGRTEDEIAADMKYLFNLWVDIRERAEKRRAPALLHHDLQVVERVLRDQMTDDFNTVWVDQEDAYEGILRFLERFQPKMVKRVRLYTRSEPIFDAFNITQELEKAIRPKVWLKSGGYIVINQTEALLAIDINTGKYVGRSNRLEDTIVKTNIEAVKEIVRQMRLRDLGGIIVVDFIDMEERKNRHKVMQALESAMKVDRAPSKILQFNDFGLVAITRRRVKQSLERTLCMPCPYCEGAAYVKSVDTVIGEILTEAHKLAKAVEGEDVVLRVHPDVAQLLKNSKNQYMEELEEILGRPVLVTADGLLHHEKFDLA